MATYTLNSVQCHKRSVMTTQKNASLKNVFFHLRKGGYDFIGVCLIVSRIAQTL